MPRNIRATLSALALTGLALAVVTIPAPAGATVEKPHLVRDIVAGPTGSEIVDDDSAALGSRLVFAADSNAKGREVWISDGTAAGTKMLADINADGFGSYPQDFTAFQGKIWFTAQDGSHGRELWVTNGTAAGTHLVKDVWPGNDNSEPRNLTVAGNKLFFVAGTAEQGRELWKTNGTSAGTVLVRDINDVSTGVSSGIQQIVALGDRVLFNAEVDGSIGNELWTSDGTTNGTKLLNNLNPGAGEDSDPVYLTRAGGHVFFSATDVLKGRELFVTDGTSLGTHRVADLNIGGVDSNPDYLVAYGSQVVLSATRAGEGREPWISDGTENGTRPITDIAAGPASSTPRGFTVFKGAVYFQAGNETYGSEVWVTRGTQGTTSVLKDTNPGGADGESGGFGVVGGALLFSSYTQSAGAELWTSDGTTPGTKLLKDIYPGATHSSFPRVARTIGNRAFLVADDGVHGLELWTYRYVAPKVASTTVGHSRTVSKKTATKKKIYVHVRVKASGKTPTGTVTIKQGSKVLGHKRLSHGKASVRITKKLSTGTHHLRAYYSGSTKAKSSKSSGFTVKVKS